MIEQMKAIEEGVLDDDKTKRILEIMEEQKENPRMQEAFEAFEKSKQEEKSKKEEKDKVSGGRTILQHASVAAGEGNPFGATSATPAARASKSPASGTTLNSAIAQNSATTSPASETTPAVAAPFTSSRIPPRIAADPPMVLQQEQLPPGPVRSGPFTGHNRGAAMQSLNMAFARDVAGFVASAKDAAPTQHLDAGDEASVDLSSVMVEYLNMVATIKAP
jgi:hypothetical protein